MRRFVWVCVALVVVIVSINAFLSYYWRSVIAHNVDSAIISFWASLVEDSIFFTIVSLSIIAVTLRHPKNETLETKIRYFFPASLVPISFINYFQSEIRKLAGLCTEAEQNLKIIEFNEQLNAYKVFCFYRYKLKNMFSNHNFEDEFQAFVNPDQFDRGAEFIAGQVTELAFSPFQGHARRYVVHPVDIKARDFDMPVQMLLRPEEEGELSFGFWLWCKVGEQNYVSIRRYIMNFTSTIENGSSTSVRISVGEKASDILTVMPSQTMTVAAFKDARPRDEHRIWWHYPKI